jgi:hypothetical protein
VNGTRPPKVTVAMVRAIMDRPPVWLARSYIPAHKSGRYPLEVLAYAVVAALRHSPYDAATVDEVACHLEHLGYGDEPVSAVWV